MKPTIKVVDGLEMLVPTWDPTPVPWNERGAWAKDEETTARVLAGIREHLALVGPPEHDLVAEALTATAVPVTEWCGTFWGSHGCNREVGHPGLCVCVGCSALFKLNESGTDFQAPGAGGDAIVWWDHGDEGSTPTLSLCDLHWTWFS